MSTDQVDDCIEANASGTCGPTRLGKSKRRQERRRRAQNAPSASVPSFDRASVTGAETQAAQALATSTTAPCMLGPVTTRCHTPPVPAQPPKQVPEKATECNNSANNNNNQANNNNPANNNKPANNPANNRANNSKNGKVTTAMKKDKAKNAQEENGERTPSADVTRNALSVQRETGIILFLKDQLDQNRHAEGDDNAIDMDDVAYATRQLCGLLVGSRIIQVPFGDVSQIAQRMMSIPSSESSRLTKIDDDLVRLAVDQLRTTCLVIAGLAKKMRNTKGWNGRSHDWPERLHDWPAALCSEDTVEKMTQMATPNCTFLIRQETHLNDFIATIKLPVARPFWVTSGPSRAAWVSMNVRENAKRDAIPQWSLDVCRACKCSIINGRLRIYQEHKTQQPLCPVPPTVTSGIVDQVQIHSATSERHTASHGALPLLLYASLHSSIPYHCDSGSVSAHGIKKAAAVHVH